MKNKNRRGHIPLCEECHDDLTIGLYMGELMWLHKQTGKPSCPQE